MFLQNVSFSVRFKFKVIVTYVISSILLTPGLACVVEEMRCSLPFPLDTNDTQSSCDLSSEGLFLCPTVVQGQTTNGVCGEGCFENDGVTPMDFEEEDPAAYFCKTVAAPCKFPFTWNGEKYSECVQDVDLYWCALEVDPVTNVMVENRWGSCDMTTCVEIEQLPLSVKHNPVEYFAKVEQDNIGVDVTLRQESDIAPLLVEGILYNVDKDVIRLAITHHKCHTMSDVSFGSFDTIEKNNETFTVDINLEKWGLSLYNDTSDVNIGEGSLVISEECDDVNACAVFACANITKDKPVGNDSYLFTILAGSLAAVFVSAVLVGLSFCFLKRKRANTWSPSTSQELIEGSPILKNQIRKESKEFDDVSLPFIDASLPPSPKSRTLENNAMELLLGNPAEARDSVSRG